MGFESVQVELANEPGSRAESSDPIRYRAKHDAGQLFPSPGETALNEIVRLLPGAKPDSMAMVLPGSTCYLIEDGSHVFEIEIVTSPPRVSCRFTLCHPPSVDEAFLKLLHQLMDRLNLRARISEATLPEQCGWYSIASFSSFAQQLKELIATRRAEWVSYFGPTQLAATTPEVHAQLILPRCEPINR